MNLGFSQVMFGKPNNFIEKIDASLLYNNLISWDQYHHYNQDFKEKFGDYHDGYFQELPPKDHTIRAGTRWKAGDKIHFVINSRSKDRFQFAPVCVVKSVQTISITYELNLKKEVYVKFVIDGNIWHVAFPDKLENNKTLLMFAQRDGFDSSGDFLKYFNTDFHGQLIHWTDKAY